MSNYLDITEYDDTIDLFELDEFIRLNSEELDEMGLLTDYEEFSKAINDEDAREAIHYDHFEDYVRKYVEDNHNIPYVLEGNIDWAGVADDMRSDHTSIEFRGQTFLVAP